jgi:hypothetical protein
MAERPVGAAGAFHDAPLAVWCFYVRNVLRRLVTGKLARRTR